LTTFRQRRESHNDKEFEQDGLCIFVEDALKWPLDGHILNVSYADGEPEQGLRQVTSRFVYAEENTERSFPIWIPQIAGLPTAIGQRSP
jgi:hypothetical protein